MLNVFSWIRDPLGVPLSRPDFISSMKTGVAGRWKPAHRTPLTWWSACKSFRLILLTGSNCITRPAYTSLEANMERELSDQADRTRRRSFPCVIFIRLVVLGVVSVSSLHLSSNFLCPQLKYVLICSSFEKCV